LGGRWAGGGEEITPIVTTFTSTILRRLLNVLSRQASQIYKNKKPLLLKLQQEPLIIFDHKFDSIIRFLFYLR
jgi:hypothetical protein